MSGGSWDYVFSKFDDVANHLCDEGCAFRRALGKHIKLVAKAMHDIEWVDSSDFGKGDEMGAIRDVLGDKDNNMVTSILIDDARDVIRQLKELGA